MLQQSFTLRLRSVGRERNYNKVRCLPNSIFFSQPGKHASRAEIKCSPYRRGVAQRVVRGIALLFHDCGTRRGWVVSSTPRPHFTLRKDPVPILRKAGWAPWPVWTGGKSRSRRDLIPDRPVRSQSLYRLSYPTHTCEEIPPFYSEFQCLLQCT